MSTLKPIELKAFVLAKEINGSILQVLLAKKLLMDTIKAVPFPNTLTSPETGDLFLKFPLILLFFNFTMARTPSRHDMQNQQW